MLPSKGFRRATERLDPALDDDLPPLFEEVRKKGDDDDATAPWGTSGDPSALSSSSKGLLNEDNVCMI